jgi:hypothetical protein
LELKFASGPESGEFSNPQTLLLFSDFVAAIASTPAKHGQAKFYTPEPP